MQEPRDFPKISPSCMIISTTDPIFPVPAVTHFPFAFLFFVCQVLLFLWAHLQKRMMHTNSLAHATIYFCQLTVDLWSHQLHFQMYIWKPNAIME